MQNFKVVMLGASGTGKTSLTIRFINGEFTENYDPTIAEDLYRKVIETNKGENYMLEIMDTSGTERYLAMRDLYIRNAQAFVLVYSITSRVSLLELENVKNYICQVKEIPISQIPIIILGNKCDLEENRAVLAEEVEYLAKQWGIDDFLETSAKIDMNIQSSFDCLTRQLIMKQSTNNKKKNGHKKHEKKSSTNNQTNLLTSSSSFSGGSNLSISSSCSTNSISSSNSSNSMSNSTSTNNLNQSITNSPIQKKIGSTSAKEYALKASMKRNKRSNRRAAKGKCLIM